ncbi:MAG TPA: radical SAM protein [Candidatus Polarisedimenticolaceae bacterium]|nr:radical SAM protein [Candidatus Polarisedimenticolaceae bacterium]
MADTPYNVIRRKAFAKALPLNCQIEITYRCNHLCTFCYNSPTGEKEMTTDQLFEALRKIRETGVLYVTLTGGEALCHKDFFKIAAEVRRLGMALRVYSNGYLMADPKVVERLAALTPSEVEISIHGAKPETHDALTRITGSFAKTWQAVDNLVAAGLKVNLKCPITRLNQDELFDIRDMGEARGLQVQFDAVITPKDDGNQDPLALRADDEIIAKYWSDWYSELHRGALPPRANHCASEGGANCGTARSGFTIDPYGNILPCVAFRRSAGNILEVGSLAEVWQKSPVLNEVRDLAVQVRQELDQHENGPYFTFCLGVAEVQTGNPKAMYPQAELNARAVRRHYELIQITDPDASAKSA